MITLHLNTALVYLLLLQYSASVTEPGCALLTTG
jgi:hypothetical protein